MSPLVTDGVTCPDCGGTCLHAKQEDGQIVRLAPRPRAGFLLLSEGDTQLAYEALVYDRHRCPVELFGDLERMALAERAFS